MNPTLTANCAAVHGGGAAVVVVVGAALVVLVVAVAFVVGGAVVATVFGPVEPAGWPLDEQAVTAVTAAATRTA